MIIQLIALLQDFAEHSTEKCTSNSTDLPLSFSSI